jgi:carboxypeptidase C (cathepsin A)
MTTLRSLVAALAGALCLMAGPLAAARADDKPDDKKEVAPVVTTHEITLGGSKIRYKATAGLMPLLDDGKKIKANIFYVAYERLPDAAPVSPGEGQPVPPDALGREQKAARPITFCFNGGPGSSSVWLHMGAIGPRRIKMGPEGEMLPGSVEIVDNDFSWLAFSDLVFIDPVSTGYSRAVEGEDPHQFHGLDEDARAVSEFIRLFLVRNQRWESPKYLAGESYGTTRAAALSSRLQGDLGIYLSGITLISPVLNFETISFGVGNDLPYWLYLPTYTATAFYHKKLAPPLDADLTRTLAEVEKWASSEYVLALAAGSKLEPAKKAEVARTLAKYTGLSEDYLLKADLRPAIFEFSKELLRDQGKTVGRYDARYTGIDRRGVGDGPDYDPSYSAVQGPFTAGLNTYVRSELKYESDVPYEILTGRVHPWNFGGFNNRYVDVADSLRSAMTQNPNLRVMVMSGYYDLATPHFAAAYTIDHLELDASLRPNITQKFFGAGHMMYLRRADLEKFAKDAAGFYQR